MKRQLVCLMAAWALMAATTQAESSRWVFRSSYYSHSPATGERVAQYAPEAPAVAQFDPSYMESGYRHIRTSIRAGLGDDNSHIVQTWGQGENIRPYGEWEYPFRAGATPYGPWGNPQGPWTLPFDSWQNPYGLGQLPRPPYPFWPYPQAMPYGGGAGPMPYGGGGGMMPYQPHGTPPHQAPMTPPYQPYTGANW